MSCPCNSYVVWPLHRFIVQSRGWISHVKERYVCVLQRKYLPLHWASATGQTNMIRFHLTATDVNCQDEVCLRVACCFVISERTLFNGISWEHSCFEASMQLLFHSMFSCQSPLNPLMLNDCSQSKTAIQSCWGILLLNGLQTWKSFCLLTILVQMPHSTTCEFDETDLSGSNTIYCFIHLDCNSIAHIERLPFPPHVSLEN